MKTELVPVCNKSQVMRTELTSAKLQQTLEVVRTELVQVCNKHWVNSMNSVCGCLQEILGR